MKPETNPIYDNLVDLHVHLGGSSAPHFLWELAHKQGIKLSTKNYWEFINSVTIDEQKDYDEYLNFFHITEAIQSSSFGVERAAHHAVSLLYRKGNINLVEIRFNPMLRNRDNEKDLDKIIFGVIIGVKKACLEYPVKAGIILMMDRRFEKWKNEIIAEKAIKFRHDGVVGLDIGGPIRKDFTIDEVVPSFNLAREKGLKLTFHTGEVTETDEMWEVLEKVKPDRIGHGVQSYKDDGLLKHLKKENITLEICPTSNLRTGVFNNWEDFKPVFDKFREFSVPITINSDGPTFLKTHVMDEFKNLVKHNIITEEEVIKFTQNARDATFIRKD